MKDVSKKILIEYIKLINEDMGLSGGDYAGIALDPYSAQSGMGGGGFNMTMGALKDDVLYKAFVKPFVDIVGVAAGSTKEIARKAITLIKVSVDAFLTSLFPILGDSFDEIFEEDKNAIEQIKSEYSAYYEATWEALMHDDVVIAAFMYRPDLFLAYGFAKKAPKIAADLLSIFTGGATDKYIDAIKSRFSESVILEKKQNITLQSLIKNDQVKTIMQKNSDLRSLSSKGQEVTNNFLSALLEQCKNVLSAKTVEEFQKVTKTKVKEIEEIKKLDPKKKKEFEQLIFQASRVKIKAFYIKILLERIQKVQKAGISDDHPFIKVHKEAIKKIEMM